MPSPDSYQPLSSDDGRYQAYCWVVAVPDGYHALVTSTIEVREASGPVVARAVFDGSGLTPLQFLSPTRLLLEDEVGVVYVGDIAAGTLTRAPHRKDTGHGGPPSGAPGPTTPASPPPGVGHQDGAAARSGDSKAVTPADDSASAGAPQPALKVEPGEAPLPAEKAVWRRGHSPGPERWYFVAMLLVSIAMGCLGAVSAFGLIAGGRSEDSQMLMVGGVLMAVLFAVLASLRSETVIDPGQGVLVQSARSVLHRWQRVTPLDRFRHLLVQERRHNARTFYAVSLEGAAGRIMVFGAPLPGEALRTARQLADLTGLPLENTLV